MNEKLARKAFRSLVGDLTDEEKARLLTGDGMWRTCAIERLAIPALVMTDGTYGVRYSISQIDERVEPGQDFDSFLAVVGRKANQVEATWGAMRPATCFPNGSSLACSWDIDISRQMGAALAAECTEMGVNILLGPGINIRRTPLGGRCYEYFSEDPLLSGDLAAALIEGLQANGVGASLKHFACNNNEVERTTMNSVVDERALREIYLRGFARAIAKAKPWTIMSSYNRLNGVQAAEDHWLLMEVLRDEWRYDGLVMSDWHGIKNRAAALAAGTDLDMPETFPRKQSLLEAIRRGELPSEVVDGACERVLALIHRCVSARQGTPATSFDREAHHALARKFAASAIVLLKNDRDILPLRPRETVAVIGHGAIEPVIQGSGCATTTPTHVDLPFDMLRAALGDDAIAGFYRGYESDGPGEPGLRAEAVEGARRASKAIVFVHAAVGWDGEGSDRRSLALAPGHDALIAAVAAVNPNIVVVIASPDAVVMPWIDAVPAVVATFFSGQAMGGAVADILSGHTNPSGKLTTTFPLRMESIPGYLHYPGENGEHVYSEGLFVGYRSYDSRNEPVLFPFGHGLSYTRFRYGDLQLDRAEIWPNEALRLSFEVANVGPRFGQEIAQVYLRYGKPRLRRPAHELKAFAKVALAPGESRRVELTIAAEDLCYWDPVRRQWMIDDDELTVEVGASSRDIRLSAALRSVSPVGRYRFIAWDTQPVFVLDNPIARTRFRKFLVARLGVADEEADKMLEHCRNSFFGILTTLANRLRQIISIDEIRPVLDTINREIREAELAELQAHEQASASAATAP